MNEHPAWPPVIETKNFGVLNLYEYDMGTEYACRWYDAASPQHPKECGIPIDPDGVSVTIYVDQNHPPEPAAIAQAVDELWPRFAATLADAIRRSIPDIEEAIDWFWQIEDEAAPTAEQFLAASRLRYIGLSVCAERDHKVMLFDQGDLIGGHDLCLEFTHDYECSSAMFDG